MYTFLVYGIYAIGSLLGGVVALEVLLEFTKK